MWEIKQTKETVNREICKNRLKSKLKPLIPLTAVLIFISFLLDLLAFWVVDEAIYTLSRLETVEFGHILWMVVLNFSTVFTSLLITTLSLMLLMKLIVGYYKINKGSFYAIENTLIRKSPNERIRFPNTNVLVGRRLEENAFYFLNSGRYALSPIDMSTFEYSSVDDKFYLIVYDGKKQKPQLAYNMKIYKWEER